MKLCCQFVGTMLIRDPDQFDAVAQRLQTLPVVRFQVGQPASCIAALE